MLADKCKKLSDYPIPPEYVLSFLLSTVKSVSHSFPTILQPGEELFLLQVEGGKIKKRKLKKKIFESNTVLPSFLYDWKRPRIFVLVKLYL